ncbi:PREDICTED: tRNA (guanine(9)-N1)-methyltransferase isoform X2 [Ipomoea nil]|uniref:tRNA (guanine(9)-N1)-methyltransferase isoform X2 n=1 Tax=Ipomoea nil TaxID=35883 RepID=UPI000900EDBE|nr:PREDICTED: tRNA (guanine(9)-N1)-methyltransferase isoform X2 [Ipomoea nil]
MIAHYQQWRVSPHKPRIPASPSWKPRSVHFPLHPFASSHCLLVAMESNSDDHQSPPLATATSPPPATAASPPPATSAPDQQPPLSKRAQKKLLKQQRFEAKKAEKKAQLKEHKQREAERKRREWAERLAGMSEEEKLKLIEERKSVRRERMEKRSEEKGKKIERLTRAKESGQNFIIDLEFSDLMTSNELHSLVQQIMYCYAVNGRCASPAHLWLAGYQGEMQNLLEKTPGYDKWLIEKESRPYIEAFEDQKEDLVYLTADSVNVLDELDPKKLYIIGGLVDRNRWKGITMKKAEEQGIQTAKLPIGNYLKMSSSQVLTVNQVVEILLKFLELRDWKASFFEVIPQRKRCGADSEDVDDEAEGEDNAPEEGDDHQDMKRQCIEGVCNINS